MTPEREQSENELGEAIDHLDNLTHALLLPMPADFHVRQLKESLPEVVKELKHGFVGVTGDNPWE